MGKYRVFFTEHDSDYHGTQCGSGSVEVNSWGEWKAFSDSRSRTDFVIFDGVLDLGAKSTSVKSERWLKEQCSG